MGATHCLHPLGPLFYDRPLGGTVAAHSACAAKLLIRLTDGDPESVLGYEPTEETPRANTYAMLESLLDELSDTVVWAIENADDVTYEAAVDIRKDLILVYADPIRSPRFAEAVWLHIVTRDSDE